MAYINCTKLHLSADGICPPLILWRRAAYASTLSGWSGRVVVTATVAPDASTTVVVIEPSELCVALVLSPGVLAVAVPVGGDAGSGLRTGWASGMSLPMLAMPSMLMDDSSQLHVDSLAAPRSGACDSLHEEAEGRVKPRLRTTWNCQT